MIVRGLIFLALTASPTAFAKLIATPTNSPVKESYLRVKLEGYPDVSEVYFKPKQGGDEVKGEVVKEGSAIVGKFKASFLAPGSYEYRVKIQTKSGSSSKDEAASVVFIKFAVDPSLEVADPGPEGKKTLSGIDADKDGVRDDVQRWILENYSDNSKTVQALKQYSRTKQALLVSYQDRSKVVELKNKAYRNIKCLSYQDSRHSTYDMVTAIEKITYNTVDRLEAFAKANIISKEEKVTSPSEKLSMTEACK